MIRKAEDQKSESSEGMRDGEGIVTIRHFLNKDDFKAKVRLCAGLTLPPGASIGLHEHTGEDEIYIITRGEGLVNDGRGENTVMEGDAVLTGRGESHSIKNTGSGTLELLAVIILY